MLIQPPTTFRKKEIVQVTPPLGILYLAAVSEIEGHTVKVLDTVIEGYNRIQTIDELQNYISCGLSYKKILERVKNFKPDVVGITCPFTLMWRSAAEVAKLIKEYDSEVPVIAGGMHPSAVPDEVLLDKNVDFVVIGEGEVTFVKLLETLEKGNVNPQKIRGLAFKDGNQIVRTLSREPIANLDALPFPARHLVPMDGYMKVGLSHGGLRRKRYTSVITSRGCPGRCVFCSIHVIWGRNWRARSPENVVNEIEYLTEKYNVREIHFEDDNLTLNKKRIKEICSLILERKLDISWTTPNGVAIQTLDKELLRKMRQSGCFQLNFGIESGNSKILHQVIKKPINLDYTRRVIKYAGDLGIWTHGFFIIGLPDETMKTIRDTINFAKSTDLDSANFFIATPYPGTELYEICKSKGYIPEDFHYERLRVQDAIVKTGFLTSDELLELQRKAYCEFAQSRIIREVRSFSFLKKLKSKEDFALAFRKLRRFLLVI